MEISLIVGFFFYPWGGGDLKMKHRYVRPQFAHFKHKSNVNLCESNFPESNENEEVEADFEGRTRTLRVALVLPNS